MVFVLNIVRMINIYNIPVGASLLAKNPRALRGVWFNALSFTTIASRLAPTVVLYVQLVRGLRPDTK